VHVDESRRDYKPLAVDGSAGEGDFSSGDLLYSAAVNEQIALETGFARSIGYKSVFKQDPLPVVFIGNFWSPYISFEVCIFRLGPVG